MDQFKPDNFDDIVALVALALGALWLVLPELLAAWLGHLETARNDPLGWTG